MSEIWRYFEGQSREAVQAYFLNALRQAIEVTDQTPDPVKCELRKLAEALTLPQSFFDDLSVASLDDPGKVDSLMGAVIKADAIEELVASLGLDMLSCFRPRAVEGAEFDELVEELQRRGNPQAALPCGGVEEEKIEWSREGFVRLYLVVCALRELRRAKPSANQ